jgi:hypothetical protein
MAGKGKKSVHAKSARMSDYGAARQEVLDRFYESDTMTTTALGSELFLIDVRFGFVLPDATTAESWRRRRGEFSKRRTVRIKGRK